MSESVSVPITLKTRIGVDELDSEAFFFDFIERATSGSSVRTVIVHARKAWLKGLSPKENREVPPLDYERVYALARHRPDLNIVLNGGLVEVAKCLQHIRSLGGVMLGRAAYQRPWLLAELSAALGHPSPASRQEVVEEMVAYVDSHVLAGGRVSQIARHMLGLFRGCPGGRSWRQILSQNMHAESASPKLLLQACPEKAAA